MKLAEALIERKALKDEIKDLRGRLRRAAKVQEGDAPVEDPTELLGAIDDKVAELERHIVEINRTNMTAELSDGRSLMEAIAERDMLQLRRSVLDDLVEAATPTPSPLTRNEIRFVPAVDVSEIQAEADATAKRYRELDAEIQAVNWEAEVD
ncbi:MAG: DIP1984 family protein [Candidatus Bipolaricaulia bacterium]